MTRKLAKARLHLVAVAAVIDAGVFWSGWYEPHQALWQPGVGLVVLGLLLRLWGILYMEANRDRGWLHGGPFRVFAWFPHPRYIGTIAIAVGVAFMLGQTCYWLATIGAAAVVVPHVLAARIETENARPRAIVEAPISSVVIKRRFFWRHLLPLVVVSLVFLALACR